MKIQTNKLKINEVFEIRLRVEHMQKIFELAKMHKITLSWVTRICLFKLIRHCSDLKSKVQLVNAKEKEDLKNDKEKNIKLHRHSLCLYGSDSVRVRFLAADLGLTITQLVRIALVLFLKGLSIYIDKDILVKTGVKLVVSVMEFLNSYKKNLFVEVDYWPFRPCYNGRSMFK